MLGVYWTDWSDVQITTISQASVIYLFGSESQSDGSVSWTETGIAKAVRAVRARGQRVILTLGGAGHGIKFENRAMSTNFVQSVLRINRQLSGNLQRPVLDGIDFNTYEADAHPDATEYMWMARELRSLFGKNFIITSPPAPWSARDMRFCQSMLDAGLMDYASPQFYDGPGLADPDYIVSHTTDWVREAAGGDARKIVVGFGIADAPNYSTLSQAKATWSRINREHPQIRGAFLWGPRADELAGHMRSHMATSSA